jgi:hypothetical protein
LEECGSEVEDDDVLKEYKDKIFMLLMPGEKWHDVKEDDKQLNNSALEIENTIVNTSFSTSSSSTSDPHSSNTIHIHPLIGLHSIEDHTFLLLKVKFVDF